ncbi:MAG: S26 family signal peptidase, partial [Verrucomicrobiae bacterium]|nr:S26 family signal peptidase [Verrucomicrobiae bacterium]
VVLHQITGSAERDLIKRVIALPGEEIEMRSCEVEIDGRVLVEPYLDPTVVNYKRWRQRRRGPMPTYSIFAQ